jgi:serine/threonine protein phosphatase PrpC
MRLLIILILTIIVNALKINFGVYQSKKASYFRSDDSYFITRNGKACGVFDGVGSWRDLGIDCSIYSNALAREVSSCITAQSSVGSNQGVEDLVDALDNALKNVKDNRNGLRYSGSSTACIAALDPAESIFSVVNLGDSGCIVCRPSENNTESNKAQIHSGFRLLLCTSPMLMGNNAPYQVGYLNLDSSNLYSSELYAVTNMNANTNSKNGSGNKSNTSQTEQSGPTVKPLTSNIHYFQDEGGDKFDALSKQAARLKKLQDLSGYAYEDPAQQESMKVNPDSIDPSLLQKKKSKNIAISRTLRALTKKKNMFNTATQSDKYECLVQPGDIIIMGSDGLWDNLFLNDIFDTLQEEMRREVFGTKSNSEIMLEGIVKSLGNRAKSMSITTDTFVTPYSISHLLYQEETRKWNPLNRLFSALDKKDKDGKERKISTTRGEYGLIGRGGGPRFFSSTYVDVDSSRSEMDKEVKGLLKQSGRLGGKTDDIVILIGIIE